MSDITAENGTIGDVSKIMFNNLCRCCMNYTSKELQLNFNSYSEFYTKTTSIQANDTNILPNALCETCSSRLDLIKNFIEICLETDLKLRKMAERLGLENTHEVLIKEENNSNNIRPSKKTESVKNLGESSNNVFIVKKEESEKMKVEEIESSEEKSEPCKNKADWSFKCHTCKIICKTSEILNAHLTKSKKCKVPCKICSRVFKNPTTLKYHIKIYHKKDLPTEKISKRHFPIATITQTKSAVEFSKEDDEPTKPAKCTKCSNIFLSIYHLRQHMYREHSKIKLNSNLECIFCEESFGKKSDLDDHILEAHTSNYKCTECPMKFRTKQQLGCHMHRHTTEV